MLHYIWILFKNALSISIFFKLAYRYHISHILISIFSWITLFSKLSYWYFVNIDIPKGSVDISSIFQKMAIYRKSIFTFHFKSKMSWSISIMVSLYSRASYKGNIDINICKNVLIYQFWYQNFQEWPNRYQVFHAIFLKNKRSMRIKSCANCSQKPWY